MFSVDTFPISQHKHHAPLPVSSHSTTTAGGDEFMQSDFGRDFAK